MARAAGTFGPGQTRPRRATYYLSARRERELTPRERLGRAARGATAEKPTAEKLDGDPQNLIRAMPA
jgi:hypothetical protein